MVCMRSPSPIKLSGLRTLRLWSPIHYVAGFSIASDTAVPFYIKTATFHLLQCRSADCVRARTAEQCRPAAADLKRAALKLFGIKTPHDYRLHFPASKQSSNYVQYNN
ncbi:hypothetical protein JTE90_007044 [Oedothorax gibbosus]|uniref:Uncharacterized protein n=1 Tax=Oedothorax gibbosus TaxID=931172 RepID=A0AAV6U6T3_9ARAC|nr:hypothetical protein JTE90_007044 [Oedothorax gibbosus]